MNEIKEANKDFQEIRTLQSALKDEQSSATKAQKELVKLQQQGESERNYGQQETNAS